MSDRTRDARRGFSIRLFMAEGEPDGLQIIEHSQWIGRGVVIPRSRIDRHTDRPELDDTGIFLLAGRSERTGVERLYIGHNGELRQRVRELQSRDFWRRLMVFSAEGERLHRVHAEYIRASLVRLARQSGQAELENSGEPDAPRLSEGDRADADYFCDQVIKLMPALGVRAFEVTPPVSDGGEVLRITTKGVQAAGAQVGEAFVVRRGSTASRQVGEGFPGFLHDLRRSLQARGILSEDAKFYRFERDHAFASAAEAATLVLAQTARGDAWKPGGAAQVIEPGPARSEQATPAEAGREG